MDLAAEDLVHEPFEFLAAELPVLFAAACLHTFSPAVRVSPLNRRNSYMNSASCETEGTSQAQPSITSRRDAVHSARYPECSPQRDTALCLPTSPVYTSWRKANYEQAPSYRKFPGNFQEISRLSSCVILEQILGCTDVCRS